MLFFAIIDTPSWIKVAIAAALGYLICPFDVVPDFIPIAGYLDDLAVLVMLLAEISVYETKAASDRANNIEANLFS